MKNKKVRIAVQIIVDVIAAFLLFWFTLPPLNPRSQDFWGFVLTLAIICLIVFAVFHIGKLRGREFTVSDFRADRLKRLGKKGKIIFGCVVGVVALFLVAYLSGAEIFNASRYSELLPLEDGNFSQDVAELSMSQIPVVDRDTASRLGQRKLGEISELVSQFEIEEDYTQINYQGRPVRVTPLAYGDLIKWFGNQSNGIPAYITVDMTTQETQLVRLDEGIKYSRSEYFLRNLNRYLRFCYPTKIFEAVTFEIDENGTPYWIASVIDYKIGFWGGADICGAVLLNAQTGESTYYEVEDVPTWVDTVYSANMLINQLTYNGKYRSGFFNSIFGQKGVLRPTEGYNYIAIGDDVYLYTGMTSVTSDQSNVGFVLINMRTKEARYYVMSGAEEYSAMESAQGAVQEKKYTATFPILLNIAERPTYFMSLKDGAGLVKMYAFVDMEQYQIVGTGNTVDEARQNYVNNLMDAGVQVDEAPEEDLQETTVSGVVAQVSSAVVDGNTKYYVMLQGDSTVYVLPVEMSSLLPFVKEGDTLSMVFAGEEEAAQLRSVEVVLG